MNVSKAVLITGCSSGIGWATAERLADVGWRVYATARNVQNIAPLEQRGCELLSLDVTDEDSMSTAVDEIERREGAVGVLVNNAGYSQSGAMEAVSMGKGKRQFETEGFGVKVSIIEPGLIKTGFAETAVGSMDSSDGEHPYAGFDEGVARATADNYERGPISKLSSGPEAVAETIERAISARIPRSRYAVTPSAHLLMGLRRLLPDRVWDAALRTSYPQPGR